MLRVKWLPGKGVVLAACLVLAWVAVFAYGWDEATPEATAFNAGGTHAWGLRFMPACTPFGADATCGYDLLLLLALAVSLIVLMVLLTLENPLNKRY